MKRKKSPNLQLGAVVALCAVLLSLSINVLDNAIPSTNFSSCNLLYKSENANLASDLIFQNNLTISSPSILNKSIYPNEEFNCNTPIDPGSFDYSGLIWEQLGSNILGEASGNELGNAVAVSSNGHVMALGANYNNGGGNSAGHVRVYELQSGVWVQLGQDIDGEASSDQSGYAVSLSGDGYTVAIGAPYNDGGGNNAGHVRVYHYNGSIWQQLGADINGDVAGDQLGRAVAISEDGSIVAIGAPYNDDNGSNSGKIKIMQFSGGAWVALGSGILGQSASSLFGWSVAINNEGRTVAGGAIYNSDVASFSGQVSVYNYQSGNWVQSGTDINGTSANDNLGWSVSLNGSGDRVAVGVPNSDNNGAEAGHVSVYQKNGASWSQIGTSIIGEASGDRSGWSISLSESGYRLAIGARNNSGNGSFAGQARVFGFQNNSWTQLGDDIDGDSAEDWLGRSVALSRNGEIMVVGAPRNDGNGSNSGQIKAFQFSVIEAICYDATITLSLEEAVGGSGDFAYLWQTSTDGGSTWEAAVGDNSGLSYTTENLIVDAKFRRLVIDNVCGSTESSNAVKIVVHEEISLTPFAISATCGEEDGVASVNASGGVGEYIYLWSTGADTATINNLAPGDYEVTVTDSFGCVAVVSVTVSEASCPDIKTWTGMVSGEWGDAGNWSDNIVPVGGSSIIIPESVPNLPVLSSDIVINNLSIAADGYLTIASGVSFRVTGTSSGKIRVERNLTQSWHFVSSPVIGATLEDYIAETNLAIGSGSNIGLAPYVTATDTYQYANFATSGTWNSGKGYITLLDSPGTIAFMGEMPTSDTNITLVSGGVGNFNLIGNPYPSYINVLDLLLNNSDVLDEITLWVWQAGSYKTFNLLATEDLAPAQGFIVGGTGVFNITKNMQQDNGSGTFYTPTELPGMFEMKVSLDSVEATTKVYMVDNATFGFDNGYDSSVFGGNTSSLALYSRTVEGDVTDNLAIQAIPDSGFSEILIPIGVDVVNGGMLDFSLSQIQNLPNDVRVYLHDVLHNTVTDLTSTTNSYQVNINANEGGVGNFYINVVATPLAVKDNELDLLKVYALNEMISVFDLEYNADLSLYNLLGQQVFSAKLEPALQQNIPVKVAQGNYLLKINNKQGKTMVSKLVVIP